jgi:hypothetical protein
MDAIELFGKFFEVKTQVHQLHHLTTSYAEHKALGKFYEQWDDLADSFIETYQGKYGRVAGNYDITTTNNVDATIYIMSAKDLVQKGLTIIDKSDIDMQNILADMIALCNHTEYLLTLK